MIGRREEGGGVMKWGARVERERERQRWSETGLYGGGVGGLIQKKFRVPTQSSLHLRGGRMAPPPV